MSRKMFDGVVLITVLVTIAINGLGKSWSRKHLTQNGSDSIGGKVAGTVELAL